MTGVQTCALPIYLRAFDVAQPRAALWEYLTESPLVDSPVIVRDRVYQQVASEGLVCLKANPLDNPGGVVVWRADTTGSVLTEHDGELLVWEADRKYMVLVDARLGAVVESIHMPNVADIMATSPIDGVIYATSPDGRITRAVPR